MKWRILPPLILSVTVILNLLNLHPASLERGREERTQRLTSKEQETGRQGQNRKETDTHR